MGWKEGYEMGYGLGNAYNEGKMDRAKLADMEGLANERNSMAKYRGAQVQAFEQDLANKKRIGLLSEKVMNGMSPERAVALTGTQGQQMGLVTPFSKQDVSGESGMQYGMPATGAQAEGDVGAQGFVEPSPQVGLQSASTQAPQNKFATNPIAQRAKEIAYYGKMAEGTRSIDPKASMEFSKRGSELKTQHMQEIEKEANIIGKLAEHIGMDAVIANWDNLAQEIPLLGVIDRKSINFDNKVVSYKDENGKVIFNAVKKPDGKYHIEKAVDEAKNAREERRLDLTEKRYNLSERRQESMQNRLENPRERKVVSYDAAGNASVVNLDTGESMPVKGGQGIGKPQVKKGTGKVTAKELLQGVVPNANVTPNNQLKPMTPEIEKQIRSKARTQEEAIKMATELGYNPYR
jgi:hypothetical protein